MLSFESIKLFTSMYIETNMQNNTEIFGAKHINRVKKQTVVVTKITEGILPLPSVTFRIDLTEAHYDREFNYNSIFVVYESVSKIPYEIPTNKVIQVNNTWISLNANQFTKNVI